MIITYEQIILFSEISHRFDEIVITMDSKEIEANLLLAQRLAHLNPLSKALPENISDPSELTPKEVMSWL